MGREQEQNPDQPLRNSSASRPAEGSRRLPTAPAANALGANYPSILILRLAQCAETPKRWRQTELGRLGRGRMPKILVCGDVAGNLEDLFKRVGAVHAKSGPFECLLCTGEFFGSADVGGAERTLPPRPAPPRKRKHSTARAPTRAWTDCLHIHVRRRGGRPAQLRRPRSDPAVQEGREAGATADLLHLRQRVGALPRPDLGVPGGGEKHLFPGGAGHQRLAWSARRIPVGALPLAGHGHVGDHAVKAAHRHARREQ